jgi:hypothetical protein
MQVGYHTLIVVAGGYKDKSHRLNVIQALFNVGEAQVTLKMFPDGSSDDPDPVETEVAVTVTATDSTSGETINGARVVKIQPSAQDGTVAEGAPEYFLDEYGLVVGLQAGYHKFWVEAEGYTTKTKVVNVLESAHLGAGTLEFTIKMTATA